jgi:uncharacterized membrane protein YkvA (DUF1232 family)
MIHRIYDGHIVGSTKPSAQAPSNGCHHQSVRQLSGHQPMQYHLEQLPGFPKTLFEFNKYDGARALTALLLLLASLYFLSGFLGFLFDHNPWLHDLFFKSPQIQVSKTAWWQFWKSFHTAVIHITSYIDISFRLLVFLCAYCLAWATFDPRNIEGYVMGFLNACLGLVYIISPIDAIPDVVPVAGTVDDAVLGLGLFLLGVSSWYRNKLRDVKTKAVLELIDHGNSQKALQMLLEDKGIAIKDSLSAQKNTKN